MFRRAGVKVFKGMKEGICGGSSPQLGEIRSSFPKLLGPQSQRPSLLKSLLDDPEMIRMHQSYKSHKSQETHKWANMWFKIRPLRSWQVCLFVAFLCFFFFRKHANYEYLCWLKRWPLCNWEVGSACSSPPPEVPVEIRRVGTFTSPFYSFKKNRKIIWNEKW